MRQVLLFLFLIGLYFIGSAQQTINSSITHDDLERDYIIYIPANYTGETSVPLVLNFHGYTSTANAQMWYGDFRTIADTAGFIIVHPEGTLLQGSTHWNVGGWTLGSTVDDVGFSEALIDSLANEYNIDLTRVYSTGMSNGGYMSFLLACQASDRIAAIASVTGSMTPQTFNACNPEHPTPIMQIHGTTDGVVPYDGANWTNPIEDVIQYWVEYNNCNSTPTSTALPDMVTTDGSTVEHFLYNGGDNGATTEHFKVTGGDHTWPGNAFGGTGTNYDINASFEIWKFFSRYDINGLIETTDVELIKASVLNIYPNPTNSKVNIEMEYSKPIRFEVVSALGENILSGILSAGKTAVDISELSKGIYFLKIGGNTYKIVKN
jgi:polyhydroxybutyrate depolymerase